MPKVNLIKPGLHPGQREVVNNANRFNALKCGRRWGKSKLGVRLAMETIIAGGPVGYFVPTYDFCDEFWEEIKERLERIKKYKSESKHLIRFYTEADLKIFSLEKKRAGRGKKFKRVIIDEAAFVKDLDESWNRVLRATLADYEGDAWVMSTPYGTNNYFATLCSNAGKEDFQDWATFTKPTSNNPLISKVELEKIKKQVDELTWLQEYEAQEVDFNGKPWVYSFDKKKHVKEFAGPIKKYPLYVSFDFNVNPITAIICQHDDDKDKIRIHAEYRLGTSDTYQLCDQIIADWGDHFLMVTGDASGKKNDTAVKDNMHNYEIIKQKFNLEPGQLKVPTSNPRIRNSRVLTNSLLSRHPSIFIHPRCNFLIQDLQFVQATPNGEIDKTKDAHKTHLLDCIRYYFNTWHYEFIKLYHE